MPSSSLTPLPSAESRPPTLGPAAYELRATHEERAENISQSEAMGVVQGPMRGQTVTYLTNIIFRLWGLTNNGRQWAGWSRVSCRVSRLDPESILYSHSLCAINVKCLSGT